MVLGSNTGAQARAGSSLGSLHNSSCAAELRDCQAGQRVRILPGAGGHLLGATYPPVSTDSLVPSGQQKKAVRLSMGCGSSSENDRNATNLGDPNNNYRDEDAEAATAAFATRQGLGSRVTANVWCKDLK